MGRHASCHGMQPADALTAVGWMADLGVLVRVVGRVVGRVMEWQLRSRESFR